MLNKSVIKGFLIGSLVAIGSLLSLAVVNYPGGMQNLWGTSNITSAAPGQVYFNTDSNTFWVGGVSSNPVKVGTIGVATTNDINAAVADKVSTNETRVTFIQDLAVSNLTVKAGSEKWTDSPMVFAWPNSGPGSPSLTAIAGLPGVNTLGFDDNDELNGAAQLPHGIAQTNAQNVASLFTELHCHVIPLTAPPADANRTQVQAIYGVASINGTFYGPLTNTVTVVLSTNTHHYVDFPHINATNYWPSISAIYWATFKRVASPSSNFTGKVGITADVHYPIGRLGSNQEASE